MSVDPNRCSWPGSNKVDLTPGRVRKSVLCASGRVLGNVPGGTTNMRGGVGGEGEVGAGGPSSQPPSSGRRHNNTRKQHEHLRPVLNSPVARAAKALSPIPLHCDRSANRKLDHEDASREPSPATGPRLRVRCLGTLRLTAAPSSAFLTAAARRRRRGPVFASRSPAATGDRDSRPPRRPRAVAKTIQRHRTRCPTWRPAAHRRDPAPGASGRSPDAWRRPPVRDR